MTFLADNLYQMGNCQITFDKEYRPETSFIFILLGTGILLVFIKITLSIYHLTETKTLTPLRPCKYSSPI